MRSKALPLFAAAALGTLCAFALSPFTASDAVGQAAAPAAAQEVPKAICVVQALGDVTKNKLAGKVVFTKVEGGIEIVAEVTGLAPGKHGFHVHEFGDCSMADGVCAGGHFNPGGQPHGSPDAAKRHAGDFGNLTADADGKATYKRVDKLIAFSGPNSIIGRSIIVHAAPDDFSQPTGNAGARIGCGVIGIGDPKMTH